MERKFIAAAVSPTIVARGNGWGSNISLDIFTDSGVDDGAAYPAQHVSVYGKEAIEKLRVFCDETIKLMEQSK